ncbi:MAG: hypothetical protein WAT09_00800 [Paracoccaceae bacterium]
MVFTLPLSGLTPRTGVLARLFAARQGRGVASAAVMEMPSLAQRLHVPVLAQSDETAAGLAIRASYAAMAAAGQWDGLLAALRIADQARSVGPDGQRLAILISQGARDALGQSLARRDWPAAATDLGVIAAVQGQHPGDYTAAHLLAQAHLDLGWARRSTSASTDADVPRAGWLAFLHQTALAEAVLEPFDPLQEMSPLLAGTRYLLVRGLEDGEELYLDWYEDWSDLDPSDAAAHAAHAVHLLPNWFGTYALLDQQARAAMARTRAATGAAAYAVFHLSATEALGDLPVRVDLALFVQGLQDFAGQTGCQHRANIVADALSELDHSLAEDVDCDPASRQLVRAALGRHLRDHLREFHFATWQNGHPCMHYAVTQVFGDELARGEHIFVGPKGLVARPS